MNNAKKIETWFDLFRILVAVLLAYVIALIILGIISDDPLYVIGQFITAVIGAIVVIWLASLISKK